MTPGDATLLAAFAAWPARPAVWPAAATYLLTTGDRAARRTGPGAVRRWDVDAVLPAFLREHGAAGVAVAVSLAVVAGVLATAEPDRSRAIRLLDRLYLAFERRPYPGGARGDVLRRRVPRR